MVYLLHLISGLLLSSLYLVATSGVTKTHPQLGQNVSHPPYNTTREPTDQDVENIVKPFKFLRTNLTTTKLKKSESYPTTQKSRTNGAKSVDIDTDKYSPDFQNTVFTLPESPEDFHNSHETLGHLTTPKTPFFDEKYRKTVESVNQKLDIASEETDWENATITSNNNTSENSIEEPEETAQNGTVLEYKRTLKLQLNETSKPRDNHGEFVRETHTKINFETKKNNTVTYDTKRLLEGNEVEKSVTKPSTVRSDAGLISNKIESDIFKPVPTVIPKVHNGTKSNVNPRGSIRYTDYLGSNRDAVVQENQVVPVQVTPPVEANKDSVQEQSTTVLIFIQPERETTTTLSNHETTTNFLETTTFFEETTVDSVEATTHSLEDKLRFSKGIRYDSTLPSTATTIRENEETTTYPPGNIARKTMATTTDPTITTRKFEETTTIFPEIPTGKIEDTTTISPEIFTREIGETTTILPEILTRRIDETTTISTEIPTRKIEETTNSQTTSPGNIELTTPTENLVDPTTPSMRKIDETTTIPTTTSVRIVPTTLPPTTPSKSVEETTTQTISIETTTPLEIQTTTITFLKETTTDASTQIIIDTSPTKKLLENQTLGDGGVKVPTTSISFVHIKNIDKNHTTLLPDFLGPDVVYSTPTFVQDATVNTTTEATTTEDPNAAGQDGPSASSGAVVAIIISCVGGACLIALACLLIIMRNRQKRFNYGQRCRPVSLDDYSVDNVSVFNSVRRKAALRSSKRSYGNPAFDDPVCLSHPLNFPAISKFAANTEDVHAEFSEIPQIIARTSELPEGCEIKNRYANVIPLPESRVFLKDMEGYTNSDYINANYVSGPKNARKYYIACQAPMSNTVDDFWRMIWEQQCKVILMLTHLFENGAEKCFDYLPPSEVLDCHRLFGDFQVTLKKREVKEKYIISSIQLKNMVSNSWREVTHFWYMGWPEKGIPAEANSIIAFLIEARSYMKSSTIDKKENLNGMMNGSGNADVNPVVVHCSPGTGRTGTVITCDIAIREFEQTRQVDIPKIVYRIRRDRANAVQTKEQYAFIYKVLDLYASKLAGGGLESI